jgi:hypothetical protein
MTTELAALLVHNDFLRAEMDDQNLRAAREAERRAMTEQIAAMRRAADAAVVSALVQGGMAAAGGAMQCASSLGQIGNTKPAEPSTTTSSGAEEPSTTTSGSVDGPCRTQEDVDREKCMYRLEGLGKGGCGLSGIAAPAGELLKAGEKRADTDAAQARNAATQASDRADEAARHRDRVERHTDSVLDLVEGTLDMEHQGNLAILANF